MFKISCILAKKYFGIKCQRSIKLKLFNGNIEGLKFPSKKKFYKSDTFQRYRLLASYKFHSLLFIHKKYFDSQYAHVTLKVLGK